jgi:hypothetical protein
MKKVSTLSIHDVIKGEEKQQHTIILKMKIETERKYIFSDKNLSLRFC